MPMPTAFSPLRALIGAALDVVMPPQCPGCGALVDQPGLLCSDCWNKITFTAPPWCASCGLPFEFDPGDGFLCASCAGEHPPYAKARAAVVYDQGSRGLVLGFKHADRTERARTFSTMMIRAGSDVLNNADVLVPVPLHWSRLFARRYNQAALLAHAIGGDTDIPVVVDILERHRRTQTQGHLSRRARARNLAGALRVNPRKKTDLMNKRIVVIDDVMTTGATVAACARVLKRAGAAEVTVLTLARAVRVSTS